MINYYRDMWKKHSELLVPIMSLTSTESKWDWTDKHQKVFDAIKTVILRKTILSYPDFTKNFDIHMNASDLQLGAVISQNKKPILLYSRKLNPAQKGYTTTTTNFLAIVEMLKEFKNILLGQKILVYTDHKNLKSKAHNSASIMHWKLLI